MAERRFKAFISYSHRDKRIANWLHHALETYRLPAGAVASGAPDRLHPIFKDREELPAADNLGDAIEKAIRQSDALIVLCSPASAASPWIAKEIDLYKRLNGDRNVYPVIVEGEPPDIFPAPLRERYEDGVPTGEAAEPIAADLRREGDGRKLGKLKLVAGLSGVDLDHLVQRDAARRQKRLAFVAAASVLGMVGTSALALYAIDQRDEARQQRAEADGLIEYMLTDLREQLEPVGRLEVLDGVGKRAMAYYARQKLEDLSDSELGRRARATMLVAEVENLRGNNEGALPAFQQAARTTAALLERRPEDPERLYNHGQSLFWVGYIAWQHGKMAEAEAAMEGYARVSSKLAAKDRANLDWQLEEAYSLSNLGTMDFEAGKLRDALAHYQQSKRMTEAVALKANNPVARLKEVAEAQSWISTTQWQLGKAVDAIDTRQREIALHDSIIGKDPQDNAARRARMWAMAKLGGMLMVTSRRLEAAGVLDQAIREADLQLAADPEDTLTMELARAALRDRAMLCWSRGELNRSRALFTRVQAILSDLQRRDPKNFDWNVTWQAELDLIRALTDRASDDPDILLALSAKWRSKLHADNPDHEWIAVASHLVTGLAARRMGEGEKARAAFERALTYPRGKTEELNYQSISLRAAAADRLGRQKEAEELRIPLKEQAYDPLIDDRLIARS